MLRSLFFSKSFRTFFTADSFLFHPGVNLLVGDQGAGKSTLIECVRAVSASERQRKTMWQSITLEPSDVRAVVDVWVQPPVQILAYDFERDSGRNSTVLSQDIDQQLFGMRHSHGEDGRMFLSRIDAMGHGPAPLVIMFDEPDCAMSPRSCYRLVTMFRRLAAQGHQIVASVHNPIVILGTVPGDDALSAWPNVLSVEHKRWLPAAVFMATQGQPAGTAPGGLERPCICGDSGICLVCAGTRNFDGGACSSCAGRGTCKACVKPSDA